MLLRFQRKELIETSTSSDDSDLEFKKHTVREMDNKNPLVRLGVFGRIKKVVSSYKNETLNTTDKRLMKGLFRKKLKDFDEDQELNWHPLTLYQRLKFGLTHT